MAILPFSAELTATWVCDYGIQGTCLQLARQDIKLTARDCDDMLNRIERGSTGRRDYVRAARKRLEKGASAEWAFSPQLSPEGNAYISDRLFFSTLGFEHTISVDASDFEGADIVHDLNTPGLAQKLGGGVDGAIETGTAEHVFNLCVYLANVGESLKTGGYALHFVPANNFLDHGFYQFSPTLFRDYYRANRFNVLQLTIIQSQNEEWSDVSISEYKPGQYDRCDMSRFRDHYVVLGVLVRKRVESTNAVAPQQRIYAEQAGWLPNDLPDLQQRSHDIGPLKRPYVNNGGLSWSASLPPEAGQGDSVEQPRHSKLILMEDDRPLGPAHAIHEDIRRLGAGRYSHWSDYLTFSSSEGSDPNSNGRVYRIRLLDF